MNITEKLNLKYHNDFVYKDKGIEIKFDPLNKIVYKDMFNNNKPGFWFSLDKDNYIVRCGYSENIKKTYLNFCRQKNENKVYLNESSYFGELGILTMKCYEQDFKKIAKSHKNLTVSI